MQGAHGSRGQRGDILGPKVTIMNQEIPLFPGLFPGSGDPGHQTSLLTHMSRKNQEAHPWIIEH